MYIFLVRSQNPSIRRAFHRALSFVLRFPLILMTVQVPSMVFEWFTRGLESSDDKFLVGVVLLPLFVIIASVTLAINYACIRLWETSQSLDLKWLVNEVLSHFFKIVGVALCAGLITLVGLATLLLPGFYLMAAYLYSPLLVFEDRSQPVLVYLYVSKQLAKRTWFRTMTVLSTSLGIGFGVNALISSNLSDLFASVGIAAFWAALVGIVISAVLSIVTNSWVSYYFYELTEESRQLG